MNAITHHSAAPRVALNPKPGRFTRELEAWGTRSDELAAFVWANLVNRTDRHGGYLPIHARKGDRKAITGDELTLEAIDRHFGGQAPEDVKGIHTTSADNTSRWLAFDIDCHDDPPPADAPQRNLATAIGLKEDLEGQGFAVLLEDSNRGGGYHVAIRFAQPLPTYQVHAFGKSLAKKHGLADVELFPKQGTLKQGQFGNWLRLPGRHHTRAVTSGIWSDEREAFVYGNEAVELFLTWEASDTGLVPLAKPPSQKEEPPPVDLEALPEEEKRMGKARKDVRRNRWGLKEGDGRDDEAYKIAAYCGNDCCLSEGAVLAILREWNAENLDPLSDAELRKKAKNAKQYGTHPEGAAFSDNGKKVAHLDAIYAKANDQDTKADDGLKIAERLIQSAAARCECFNDGRIGYADVNIEDRRETHPIRTAQFKHLIRRFYRADSGRSAPGNNAMQEAVEEMDARAFEGPRRKVHVRRAYHDGNIYVDLGRDDWLCVEITPHGWGYTKNPPVRFRRPPTLKPMPLPEKPGDFALLWKHLNADYNTRVLLGAWLVGTYMPSPPRAHLLLQGEQGSAKSTNGRRLLSLTDPSEAESRPLPGNAETLACATENSAVLMFDNTSYIPDWLSNALCRMATGGTFTTRAHYTNKDEAVLNATAPAILNGITNAVTAHDLADRTINATLQPIRPGQRKTEQQMDQDFAADYPRILAGVFDAVSMALQRRDTVQIKNPPRMADFAYWVTAAEAVLPWEPGEFVRIYNAQQEEAGRDAIEGDPLAKALCAFVDAQDNEWTGTASELLDALESLPSVTERTRDDKGWPKKPHVLSRYLRRLAPVLRRAGYDFQYNERTAEGRTWRAGRYDGIGTQMTVYDGIEGANTVINQATDKTGFKPPDPPSNDANDANFPLESKGKEKEGENNGEQGTPEEEMDWTGKIASQPSQPPTSEAQGQSDQRAYGMTVFPENSVTIPSSGEGNTVTAPKGDRI